MALISGSVLVLMWILGHDFSGHYNRLALTCVDIISGVYCINQSFIKIAPFPVLYYNNTVDSAYSGQHGTGLMWPQ